MGDVLWVPDHPRGLHQRGQHHNLQQDHQGCPSIYPSIHLSIYQPDHPRGLNLIYLSIYPSIHLSIYQPDHPQSTGTTS